MPSVARRRRTVASSDSDEEDASTPQPRTQQRAQPRAQASSSAHIAVVIPARSAPRTPSPSSSRATSPAITSPNTPRSAAIATSTRLLVRLALSTEHARVPLRRADINARCGTNPSTFRAVLSHAQLVLRETFGVELVELPAKDAVSVKERLAGQARAQAGQGQGKAPAGWILVSTLPKELRAALASVGAGVSGAAGRHKPGPGAADEAAYLGLCGFVVSIVMLSGNCITEPKLERHLRKVNADASTPAGPTPKLLERMVRERYLERRVDNASGEQVVEYAVGPRGRVEIGEEGVRGLVMGVFAAEGADSEELEKRVERSLKIGRVHDVAPAGEAVGVEEGAAAGGAGQGRGRGRGRQSGGKRPRADVDDDGDSA